MKTIIINQEIQGNENLKKQMKSRAILANSKGEILLSNYGGVYLLPGGTIEEGENPNTTIIRELKEELGINKDIQELQSLTKVKHFQYNYPNREGGKEDRLLVTYYYTGNAEKISDNLTLTDSEKEAGFYTKFYSLNEIERALQSNKTTNPRNEYFNKELRTVIDYYKKFLEKENEMER